MLTFFDRAESAFKALALAVREATTRTGSNEIPSKYRKSAGYTSRHITNVSIGTKGVL